MLDIGIQGRHRANFVDFFTLMVRFPGKFEVIVTFQRFIVTFHVFIVTFLNVFVTF